MAGAYDDGWDDREVGKTLYDNPFDEMDARYDEWEDGWKDSDEQIDKD